MNNRVTDKSIYIAAGVMAVAWIVAAVLLALPGIAMGWKVLVAMLPVAVLTYQVYLCYRYTIGQDEVQKRIILEGLSIAFMLAVPLVFLGGFLIKAGVSLPFSFIDGGYLLEITLLIGYTIAYRRYQ